MTVVFCLSYLNLPITLSIVDRCGDDFLVVTSSPSLYKFLSCLFPCERLMYIEPPFLEDRSPVRMVRNLIRVGQYKKKIYALFKGFRNADIYFFGIFSCEFEAWLVKRLSSQNNIYYDSLVDVSNLMPARGLKVLIGKCLRRMAYNIEFSTLYNGKTLYYGVSDAFLNKVKPRPISAPVDERRIEKIAAERLELRLEGRRILFLCGGIAGIYVDMAEYTAKMDSLIRALKGRFGEDALAIKAHPRYDEHHSEEDTLFRIPAYIPASLIMHQFDVVIGYFSSALFEAAMKGMQVISMLGLLEPVNMEIRKGYIAYLSNNSGNRVLFPGSVEEAMDFIGHTVPKEEMTRA